MSWWRLLGAVARPAAGRLTVAVLAGVAAAGAGVGLMATAAWLISRAALHPPVLHLMVAIVAVRAFGISRGVLRYAERLIGHDAALRVLGALRVRLYTRLERLAPAGLAEYRRADLVQRMVGDVDAVLDLLTRVVLPYAVAAVVGAGSVGLVGFLCPPAGVVLALGLLGVGLLVPLLQAATARRADGRFAPLRGELATDAVDLLHGLPDLVAYGAADAQLARLAATDARLRAAQRRSSASTGTSAAVSALATGLCVVAGLAAGAVAVRAGTLPGELLAVVVLTPLAVFEAAAGLPAAAQRYAAARGSLRRLADVCAAPDPVAEPDQPAEVPAGPHTLRVSGVSAAWVPGRPVVHGVDLELSPGRRVALVGASGSGKSTVAALLVRWLDPCAGRITLDGVDLRRIPGDQVRRVVGYLPEDAYLFDTTIEENLRIGRRDATVAQLRAALADARLLDWVDGLPLGLDTPVGEHGMALSGGQRRRLALARALLADFSILVLDEPTEHLDEATAAALTRDLLAAARDRAVLLITHRTDGLSDVDEVIRLGAVPTPVAA
ncbi:ATP-binding cassette subfamily C protein CydC [Krasilnikovia cinnamomea]|uniref:ATP-binding cassette subfamily C protein CydC n=1 Tax=Krasilnikovia cinnamomea TaxID=349313 RepID=A0A4Q7ZUL3_9ACTN|nr:thiol reductant ABC exporter subunit CydC [Krasilnikovia cinnamomea]RZU54601.1 ATP-binding cassette subfamily C protein CydC [Krasilnikovia cinnamomea]